MSPSTACVIPGVISLILIVDDDVYVQKHSGVTKRNVVYFVAYLCLPAATLSQGRTQLNVKAAEIRGP